MEYATNPLDGTPIAWRSAGASAGTSAGASTGADVPPVLLLHGTALSQAIWRGFGYVRELGATRPVITLDLRGHGRSGKPRHRSGYAMDLFVADIAAVLDAAGVRQADLVGYSLGGRTGFSFADAHPERVRRFVSVAGAPGNRPGAFDRVFFPQCIRALEGGGMPGFLAEWEADTQHPLDPATRAAFAANDAEALAAYMREAEADEGVPAERLAALALPLLLLVGVADAERLAAAEYVRGLVPSAELLVVDGAGHGDILRTPEAHAAISTFLS